MSKCKQSREYARTYYWANVERLRAYHREWNRRHKDVIYPKQNAAKRKERREQHEKVLARKAERLAKLQRVCPVCGKAFVTDPTHLGTKCCSIACANRARTGIKHAAKHTAAPTADQSYEAFLARVRAYLKLPARARWANRGMLTDTELRMAEHMWENGHGGWNVHYNTIH